LIYAAWDSVGTSMQAAPFSKWFSIQQCYLIF
jgi:hypothetical protein